MSYYIELTIKMHIWSFLVKFWILKILYSSFVKNVLLYFDETCRVHAHYNPLGCIRSWGTRIQWIMLKIPKEYIKKYIAIFG